MSVSIRQEKIGQNCPSCNREIIDTDVSWAGEIIYIHDYQNGLVACAEWEVDTLIEAGEVEWDG